MIKPLTYYADADEKELYIGDGVGKITLTFKQAREIMLWIKQDIPVQDWSEV